MKLEIKETDYGNIIIKCPNCELNLEFPIMPDHFTCPDCEKYYSVHGYFRGVK